MPSDSLPSGCTEKMHEDAWGEAPPPCEECEIEKWLARIDDVIYDAMLADVPLNVRRDEKVRWAGAMVFFWRDYLSVAIKKDVTGFVEAHVANTRNDWTPCERHMENP